MTRTHSSQATLALATLAALGLAAATPQQARAQITVPGAYNAGGPNGGYTNSSSFPIATANDLVLGLTPTATNYVGEYEAAGGTPAPLTDGNTSTDPTNLSQPTSAGNSVFDLGNGVVYFTYTLPTSAYGYNLSDIQVTTGHQDNRVNQNYDILVSTLSDPTFTSLSGGAGFTYAPAGGAAGTGGAAQSTLTSATLGGTGLLASNVTGVEFQILANGEDVYRELGVYGVAATQPPPPPPPHITVANPSFEVDNASALAYPGYTTDITGWTATGRTGLNNNTNQTAFADNGTIPNGSQVAFLQSTGGLTTLSQSLSGFTAGHQYEVTFYDNARQTPPADLSVTLGGALVYENPSLSAVGGSRPYHFVTSAPFTATTGIEDLVFSNKTAGDTTALIDDIQVLDITPAPEPSQLAGLGLGVLGLGALALKARKRTA